jgi:predicted RNA-binding protein (virulence factor B family)
LTDKSSPEEIYKTFKFSKKNFKAAIGTLYKKRIIALEENGIRLLVSE